ncbi:MAG: glycosyltransferase family 2 protein [Polyangiaceae bacterium]|nr:glycosyltransferase family 2 protein [Polyangiaceae bacterium]
MDLSVVIPVYNERENLRRLVEEIESALTPGQKTFEIVAVDDGSTDGSRELLEQLHQEKPFLKVVVFRRNCGQAAAFDAGFRFAEGNIVATMDADLQNDPSDIPHLIEKLESGFDVVSGWRKNRKDGMFLRKIPSKIANACIRAVTKTKVHDLGCSLKVYRREIANELRLYGEMHRFLTVLAESQGASVAEMVVNHRPRHAGTSKYGLGRTIKVMLDLLTVWFFRSFQTKPIYVFGGAGVGLLGGGALLAGIVLYQKFAYATWVHRNPLFMISVMCVLMASQLIGLGLLAEIMMRTYFESQAKYAYPIANTWGISKKPQT